MVEYEAGTAINTDPLRRDWRRGRLPPRRRRRGHRRRRARPSPRHRVPARPARGCTTISRDERIRFVDLNQDDVREVPLASRFTGLDVAGAAGGAPVLGLHRLDAEAEDASLGGDDGQHEELLRRRAGRGLRVAEEHPARARDRRVDSRSERDDPAAPRDPGRGDGDGRGRSDHGQAAARGIRRDVARSRLRSTRQRPA